MQNKQALLATLTFVVVVGSTWTIRHFALGAIYTARQEQGACVPDPMEGKPEGAVGCKCYEITHCKGNESHQCKRHCRKDLCQCCDI